MISERLEKMTPKEKKDLEVLVKTIIQKDENMIHIKDSALIAYYPHKAKYIIEVEPEKNFDLRFLVFQGKTHLADFNGMKAKQLELAKKLVANYIFVSNFYDNGRLVGVVTPFRIISRKEEEFLLKNFYKDVPEEVSEAAEDLEVMLYDKLYSYYIKGRVDMFGEILHANRNTWDDSPFFDFVFNLPYEEQNIESNKKMLRITPINFDLVGVIVKEYAEGKHFHEYFENISNSEGKKVVEAIKHLERKPDNDVFLLTKGYVVGEDSAMHLYRQNMPQAFINYFKKLNDESKKLLIEKIYEEPYVNHEVVAWLEKDYTYLLREVGFSGGKQNGSNS